MSAELLGRRYERLLFMAAPLTFASILILFIAVALTTQQNRIKARCYESAAEVLSKYQDQLASIWEFERQRSRDQVWGIAYRRAASVILGGGLISRECTRLINSEVDGRFKRSPTEIIKLLKQDANELLHGPVSLYGVEIPEKATVSLLGSTIRIELETFLQSAQLVLGPVLILWLGSIYNTRYRESILISRASAISDVFPHLINIYPVGRLHQARKKSWIRYYMPYMLGVLYSTARMFLLMVFVLPPAIAYVASLIVLPPIHFAFVFYIFGFFVCVNSLAVIFIEYSPWHYKKIFE